MKESSEIVLNVGLGLLGIAFILGIIIGRATFLIKPQLPITELQLELALAKTENRVLAQKLAACQNPPVEREPKPILNF